MRSKRRGSNRKGKVSEDIPGTKECFGGDGTQIVERGQNANGLDEHSAEYVTNLFNEIKSLGDKCDVYETLLEHSLEVFKSFSSHMQSEDEGCSSQNEKLLLLDIINWIFSLLTTKTRLNSYEEVIESFLQSIRRFFFSKLWNETAERNEQTNSKKVKLCIDEKSDNNKINNKLLTFYDFLPNLIMMKAFTEFGICEVLSCSFFTLSSEMQRSLNIKAIKVISEVFLRCERARVSILDDIFLLLKKEILSNQRHYLNVDREHKVLLLTALLLSVFQSIPQLTKSYSAPLPIATEGRKRRSLKAKKCLKKDARVDQSGSYKNYLVLSQHTLTNFFINCGASEDKFGADLFSEFLDDIINMANHIEWPSAHLLVLTSYQVLMKLITNKSKEVSLRVTSCHYIGKIYKFLSSYIYPPKTIECITDAGEFSTDSYRTVILKWLVHSGDKMNACNFHISQWRYVDSLMNVQPDNSNFHEGLSGQLDDKCNLPPDVLKQMYRILSSSTWCLKVHDMLTKYMFQLASDDSVAIRLKAVQYLSHFAILNPDFLKQKTFVELVHTRVIDSAPSVRSSVIELIGQVVCTFEDSVDLYFEDLSNCCSDVSISVRKQTVVALKDFLLSHLEHSLAPDVMLCMINRISDEEPVKKHVLDTFSKLITEGNESIVCGCFRKMIEKYPSQTTLVSLEKCLLTLLEPGDSKVVRKDSIDRKLKEVVHKGIQMFLADCRTFEQSGMTNSLQKDISSCSLLLKIFSSLELHDCFSNYIDEFIECCVLQFPDGLESSLKSDLLCILGNCLASTISLKENSMSKLQNILLRFLTFPSIKVIEKSLSCIEALMSKGMFEMMPLRELFMAMIECLSTKVKSDHREVCAEIKEPNPQKIMASLLIVGMFSKHFDPSQLKVEKSRIFECFLHYAQSMDEDIRLRALYGLGYFLQKNSDLLLDDRLTRMMLKIIKWPSISAPAVVCVLKYLCHFFANHDLNNVPGKQHDNGSFSSLKEPYENDTSSTSQMAQVFLKPLLNNFLSSNVHIRDSSFDIVSTILHQGLIHPTMCLPYLICASSAPRDQHLCYKAERLLRMTHAKYPSLIGVSTMFGLRLSYQLNVALETSGNKVIRGYREAHGKLFSCLDILFSLVHRSTPQYHSFVNCIMKCFSTSPSVNSKDCCTGELLFLSDALSCLPFTSLERIFYLIKHIDMILSNLGPGVLEEFFQILGLDKDSKRKVSSKKKKCGKSDQNSSLGKPNKAVAENYEVSYKSDEIQNAIKNLSVDNSKRLENLSSVAQKCLLLIYLKDHFHKLFNINDRILQDYSSRKGKCSARFVHPKVIAPFDPEPVIAVMNSKGDVALLIDCFSELNNHFGGEFKFQL